MKKRMISLALALAMCAAIPAPALASKPSQASTSPASKTFSFDENLILLGTNALKAGKTESGTLYWNVSPKEFVDAFNSIYGNLFKLDSLKKTKDKNIYTHKDGKVTLQLHSTSSTYSKGKLTKIVLRLDHTTRTSDFETFGLVMAGLITPFSQYDEKVILEIVEALGLKNPKSDTDSHTYTHKSAKYHMSFNSKKMVLTITPVIES